MKTITKEQCQQRALGQYLSEWGEFSYDEVIRYLKGEHIKDAEYEIINDFH